MKQTILILGIIFLLVGISINPTIAVLNSNFNLTIDNVNTQQFDRKFIKTYGGPEWDYGHCVQQTIDGGYIIIGETNSYGAGYEDVWLIKTDNMGNMVWNKTFGGTGNDNSNCVRQTTFGRYIITGHTWVNNTNGYDVMLIKTDNKGNKLWNKTFGGKERDGGCSVQQTTDGGYIIIGYTHSFGVGNGDVWLIKTDFNGNEVWNKTFGGKNLDAAGSVQQTTDGGYIIAGHTLSFGIWDGDIWLIKTDNMGNMLWNKTFGGKDGEGSHGVQQTNDGGYIIVGTTRSFGAGERDIWLIKTDNMGNMVWNKTYGGTEFDVSSSIQQTNDGGYIIVGTTRSYGAGGYDVWLIKTDSNDNIVWDRTFGGIDRDWGSYVQQTSDGGYIITGDTWIYDTGGYEVLLIKTDKNGRPRNKAISNSPLSILLEKFTLLQRLLDIWRKALV